jgi:hypothetical protein
MTAPEQLDAAIRQLVAEVVRRIQAGSVAAKPAATAGSAVPAKPAAPAAVPAPAYAAAAAPAPVSGAVLDARVVTLDLVARLPAGTRQVTVPPRAVVTPAARDLARDSGIAIVHAAAAGPAASASRPFVVALADVGADGPARAAAVARGVPGAWQIPASGLADVMQAVAAHAARDGARAVLLTGKPATAVVAANRHAALRGATGRDAAAVSSAVAETEANLLVLNPRDFPGAALERVAAAFASRPGGAVPAALAASAPGCACKSHAH